jgi:hypothetical protein
MFLDVSQENMLNSKKLIEPSGRFCFVSMKPCWRVMLPFTTNLLPLHRIFAENRIFLLRSPLAIEFHCVFTIFRGQKIFVRWEKRKQQIANNL